MQAERKRQRQQRVRQEAGGSDSSSHFAPTPPNNIEENSFSRNASLNNQENASSQKYQASDASSKNDRTQYQNKGAKSYQDFRKNDYSRYEKPRGVVDSRCNENRGRGVRHDGPPAVPVINNNVVFAEEREYEPVTVMEATATSREESEPAKYRRRKIISNWLKYDDLPPENECEEGEDYLRGEDFSEVLKLSSNSGSGGYLHLKGEISWGEVDASYLGSHGLGALKIADLVSALGTIPLHTQLDIPVNMLPTHAVSCYTTLAEDNAKLYKPNKEYVTDLEINKKITESLKMNISENLNINPKPDNIRKNPMEATKKFSSAFKVEPGDVKLDDILRESSPDEVNETLIAKIDQPEKKSKKKKKRKEEKVIIETIEAKDINRPASIEKETSLNFGVGEPNQDKKVQNEPNQDKKVQNESNQDKKVQNESNQDKKVQKEFSFNLLKPKLSTTSDVENEIIIAATQEKNTEVASDAGKNPVVDLDAPLPTEVEKPLVLISKTETENLEDWLDSFLDD